MTDGERVRKAIESRHRDELDWALTYAEEKRSALTDEKLRAYWDEIVRRIVAARDIA